MQIEKWKAENGVTGPVTVTAGEATARMPLAKLGSILCITSTRRRGTTFPTTMCGIGVVLPVVCTSGARLVLVRDQG